MYENFFHLLSFWNIDIATSTISCKIRGVGRRLGEMCSFWYSVNNGRPNIEWNIMVACGRQTFGFFGIEIMVPKCALYGCLYHFHFKNRCRLGLVLFSYWRITNNSATYYRWNYLWILVVVEFPPLLAQEIMLQKIWVITEFSYFRYSRNNSGKNLMK